MYTDGRLYTSAAPISTSMKYTTLTLMLCLVALTMSAQQRLIRVVSEAAPSAQRAFFNKEMSRLLIPQGAAFGVVCVPSNSPERALTYDSTACALVCVNAEKSIWRATFLSMNKRKEHKREHTVQWKPRKRPKNYMAPAAKTYTLAVTPQQVRTLRAMWATAVGTAEEQPYNVLDGIRWEYFIDGMRARSPRHDSELVAFTSELMKAVCTGNASLKDSLIMSRTSTSTRTSTRQ